VAIGAEGKGGVGEEPESTYMAGIPTATVKAVTRGRLQPGGWPAHVMDFGFGQRHFMPQIGHLPENIFWSLVP
jgi:hypothetical protein